MRQFIKRSVSKSGLPPGSLVHIGKKHIGKTKINVIDYDSSTLSEKELTTIEESFSYKDTQTVTWINVDGVHQLDTIEKIGKHFHLHPLVLEDIVNTEQRPKIEEFDDYFFIVLKMLYSNNKVPQTQAEQVSIILGSGFVITFQEQVGDRYDILF